MKEVVQESFDMVQSAEQLYIVEYRLVENDEFLGYHKSTFCELTDDLDDAKRYPGDEPYDQITVISNNLKGIINYKEDEDRLFGVAMVAIRKKHYQNLKHGDIYLNAVYLEEGIKKQTLKFTNV